MKKIDLKPGLAFLFVLLTLLFAVRGIPGNIDHEYFSSKHWQENGPLELSPEKGRFVLLYSIVENRTIKLTSDMAVFALPDVGYINDEYVSLFTPGVSIISIPGYLIGRSINLSQFVTFFTITLFSFFNVLLIYKISRSLTINKVLSWTASILFIFATPAFSYAVSYYQHHVTVFIILLCVYLLIKEVSWKSIALIWILYAVSIVVDTPNVFLMSPVVLYSLIKILSVKTLKSYTEITINLNKFVSTLIIIAPLILYGYFNYLTYGNPLTLSGSVQSVDFIDESGDPWFFDNEDEPEDQTYNVFTYFNTRNIVNGLYIHLLSPDRGILYYTPVLLLTWFGLLKLKKITSPLVLLLSIAIVNILIYSMWGDPWGGWAFGSRYLIPSYAILSIMLGYLLSTTRSRLMLVLVCLLGSYSIAVNTLGALTTNKLPPKIQVLELERMSNIEQKYTYERNYDFLREARTKSFMYNRYFSSYISPFHFYIFLTTIILIGFNIPLFHQFRLFPKKNLRFFQTIKNYNLKSYLSVLEK